MFTVALIPRCDGLPPTEPSSQDPCSLGRPSFDGHVVDLDRLRYPGFGSPNGGTRLYTPADLSSVPFKSTQVEAAIWDNVYNGNMCEYPVESPNSQLLGCIDQCRGFRTLKAAQDYCDTKTACGGVTKVYIGAMPFQCRRADAPPWSPSSPAGDRGDLYYPEGGAGDISWRKQATGFHEDCRTTKGQYIVFTNATVSGLYDVNVSIGGVTTFTGGSPYPIYVAPTNLSERHSIVGSIDQVLVAGQLDYLFVQAKDVYSNNRTDTLEMNAINVHVVADWCASGWYGTKCDLDEDECISQPCRHGAVCTESTISSTIDVDNYICHCLAGFAGLNCELDVDECASNPCQNGASCVESRVDEIYNVNATIPYDTYICACPIGYFGDNCDDNPNDCESQPCVDQGHPVYGMCWDREGDYFCDCSKGWGGKDCDVMTNPCSKEENICHDIALCEVEAPGQLACECHIGYEGPGCMDPADCDWNRFTVHQTGDRAYQRSINGVYSRSGWRNAVPSYRNALGIVLFWQRSERGGEWVLGDALLGGLGRAYAPGNPTSGPGSTTPDVPSTGWNVLSDFTTNDFVLDAGISVSIGTFERGGCWDRDECLSAPCQNEGACTASPIKSLLPLDAYECLCADGYTGRNCDIDVFDCGSNPCQNGGTCEDLVGTYSCSCSSGWSGENCIDTPVFDGRSQECHVETPGCGFCDHPDHTPGCDEECFGKNAVSNSPLVDCDRHAASTITVAAIVHESTTGLWNVSQRLTRAGLYTFKSMLNEFTVRSTGVQILVRPAEISVPSSHVVSLTGFVHQADEANFLHIVARDMYKNVCDLQMGARLYARMTSRVTGRNTTDSNAHDVAVTSSDARNGTYVVHVLSIAGSYTMDWGLLRDNTDNAEASAVTNDLEIIATAVHIPLCLVTPQELVIEAGVIGLSTVQVADRFGNVRVRDIPFLAGGGALELLFLNNLNTTVAQEYAFYQRSGLHSVSYNLTTSGGPSHRYRIFIARTVTGEPA